MHNTNIHKAVLTTALTALLAGCAVGPDHLRPSLDVPEQFVRAGTSATAAPTTPAESEFWRGFNDAVLSRLVDRALTANHDVRIAWSRYASANALLRGVRLDRLPTVTAEAGASDSRLSADQAPGVARDAESLNIGARVSWELDLFGRVRRNVEANRADVAGDAADLQALQVVVVAEVARDYVQLRGLQERLRVAQENSASQRETLRLVDADLSTGRGTDFDTARARAQLATTLSRVPALEADIATTMHHLAVLTGQQPAALVTELTDPLGLPALPAAPDAGTPGDLLRRRPDIAAAESRLHAATARIGVATADLFPRFSLGGLIGSQAIPGGNLFERDGQTRLIALGIDWSFLDTGRVRARIAAANAGAAGDLARYEQTVLRALEETENALVRHSKARSEDEQLQQAASDSGRAAQLARIRYDAGAANLLDVLDAERNQLQAQDAFAQSRTRSLASLVDLYRAVAGGWPDRLPGPGAQSLRAESRAADADIGTAAPGAP